MRFWIQLQNLGHIPIIIITCDLLDFYKKKSNKIWSKCSG